MTFHVSLSGRKNLSNEIYRQLRRAILERRLRPGDRLPPSRTLAQDVGVSRTTVIVAYNRLAGEGFVTSHVGAGTFVSEDIDRSTGARIRPRPSSTLQPRPIWNHVELSTAFASPARFDFRTGIADAALFPDRAWRRLIARSLRSAHGVPRIYGHPAGLLALREAIARHIGIARGVDASADDIVITNGTQQALDIFARVLLGSGDCVAVEDPGYDPPRQLFTTLGARVVGVPVDHEGLLIDELPPRARFVYVTPSHQYPLGMAMSLARRQALLAWAERNDAAIIEDDYDSEFRFSDRPLEPLQTLDTTRRVIYVGSFSKTLSPILRLGFVVVPPSLQLAVQKAKYISDWHTPTLAQAALARFIDDGGFARHVRRARQIYRERHELIVKTVVGDFADHLELIVSTTGVHIAAFAKTASTEQIAAVARAAADAGVAIQTLATFAMRKSQGAGIMLGYGGIPTPLIKEGLRRLRKAFD